MAKRPVLAGDRGEMTNLYGNPFVSEQDIDTPCQALVPMALILLDYPDFCANFSLPAG